MSIEQKELSYLNAKTSYYNGNPVMSDAQFDKLEAELREAGSSVIYQVGTNAKGDKMAHVTLMGSLGKIQFQHDYVPKNEFERFVDKIILHEGNPILEFSPKFDGNSVNLIYNNGNIEKGITRGDGEYGQDLTEKIKNIIPENINQMGLVEIRGEIIMKNSIFYEHYSEYKNPRNFVAGLLGRDDLRYEDLNRLTFVPFEVRLISGKDNRYRFPESTVEFLHQNNFSEHLKYLHILRYRYPFNIVDVYEEFKEYRANSEFLIDGFVCKSPENLRKRIGETSHHPKWALAIKFPPKSAVTKIIDIEWNLGKTGYLTPVGILEPVDLDGSIVSRVTLHNYKWISDKKVAPGATVEIVKSGDIIPAIVNVIEESTNDFQSPEIYKGLETTIENGKHLKVIDFETLPEFGANRLYKGIQVLGLQFIGPAMAERLFDAHITSVRHLFDENLINEDYLSKYSFKKGSRELERLITEIETFKEVDLWRVINALQLERVGESLSKLAAKYYSEQNVDWSGFEKVIVEKLVDNNSTYTSSIKAFIDILERKDINIKRPEEISNDSDNLRSLEFTGSPKEFGFKTKAEFLEFASSKGFVHAKLDKNSAYLLTDSYESSSSKMKKAQKLEVEIISYEDFVNKYTENK